MSEAIVNSLPLDKWKSDFTSISPRTVSLIIIIFDSLSQSFSRVIFSDKTLEQANVSFILLSLKLTKDIVSIQIDDIKAFSEVATEQINIMLDIQKVFHVYGQMPDCEPIIPRQVFTESKAFFKCQRHGETKNIRVSIRITTGKF